MIGQWGGIGVCDFGNEDTGGGLSSGNCDDVGAAKINIDYSPVCHRRDRSVFS